MINNGFKNDTLYYSNFCRHCKALLAFLSKNGFGDKMECICIDKRSLGKTGGWTIHLDNGTQHLLPPNIDRVPALLLVKQKFQVKYGKEIQDYLSPAVEKKNDEAVQGNGDYLTFSQTTFSNNFSAF